MGRSSLSVSVDTMRAARAEQASEDLPGYSGVSDVIDEALEEWLDAHYPEGQMGDG